MTNVLTGLLLTWVAVLTWREFRRDRSAPAGTGVTPLDARRLERLAERIAALEDEVHALHREEDRLVRELGERNAGGNV